MDIVGVLFQSKANKEEFAGREYSYYAPITVNVGDVVVIPVKNGTAKAKVVRTNVKDSELTFNPVLLKKIVSLAKDEATGEDE